MDRIELQDSARRAFGEGGLMPDAGTSWQSLTDMGWFMMTVPEAQGGLGLGPMAAGVIHYELGRALVPGAAIAQMLVIEALAVTGQTELLERAMAGERMTTSLSPSPSGVEGLVPRTNPSGSTGLGRGLYSTRALDRQPPPPSPPLKGRGEFAVPDADQANHILLVNEERIALAAIDAATHRPTWDETRRLFDVTPGDALVLAEGEKAKALAQRLEAQMLFALSADSLGGAEAVLAMTVDYLKTRRQFDRPLAMFQALKHRVADLKIRHAAAEALFWNRADGAPTLAEMSALKAHCCAAYAEIAEDAIQLHGGIGLTQEHDCHLFLKRAFLNRALGGDTDLHEERGGRALMERL